MVHKSSLTSGSDPGVTEARSYSHSPAQVSAAPQGNGFLLQPSFLCTVNTYPSSETQPLCERF